MYPESEEMVKKRNFLIFLFQCLDGLGSEKWHFPTSLLPSTSLNPNNPLIFEDLIKALSLQSHRLETRGILGKQMSIFHLMLYTIENVMPFSTWTSVTEKRMHFLTNNTIPPVYLDSFPTKRNLKGCLLVASEFKLHDFER